MTRPTPIGDVLGDLLRVQALFQARTIAMHLGAPMPRPEDFISPLTFPLHRCGWPAISEPRGDHRNISRETTR